MNITSNFDNKYSFEKTNQLNNLNETNVPNTSAATVFYNSIITPTADLLKTDINSTINQKISSIDFQSSIKTPPSQIFYLPKPFSNFSSNITNQNSLNLVETTLSNFNDNKNNLLITSISKNTNINNTNLNNQLISLDSLTKNNENTKNNQFDKFSSNQMQKFLQQNVCAPMTNQNLFAPTLLSSLFTSTAPLSEVSQNGITFLTFYIFLKNNKNKSIFF